MTRRGRLLAAAAALAALAAAGGGAARAEGPAARRDHYAGYVFPAGGRQGTVFRATAGGQNLGGVTGVHVTGGGVRAAVVRYEGSVPRLNGDERRELRRRIGEEREERRAVDAGKEEDPRGAAEAAGSDADAERPKLPNHPLLREIDSLTLEELDRLESRFLRFDPRRQPNAQIAETVILEIAVDAAAAPGDRDLRLVTRAGLTNPLRFQVGTLPEVAEAEPAAGSGAPALAPLEPPVLVNGQVLPGDVDRWPLRARKGQRLVIEARARALIPYLADAVPGWFQAVVSLRDAKGAEVAFADDWRFDPDPVLLCEIPADGEYRLEIRDALYRGREDFVYRVSAGEEPFITRMFPLGGRTGSAASASVAGWNLPGGWIPLDTRPGGPWVRWAAAAGGDGPSNAVPYAVDPLPGIREAEPDDDPERAQRIALPRIIDGTVSRPGDEDLFRFEGRAGDEVVAEVRARRLGSPLDSLLRLTDASGRVLAWNDDHEDREAGLLTHHADSYLRSRLPADGAHFVRLSDAQRHGGEEFAYRLRIGPPRPDFAVVAVPSSLNVPAGGAVAVMLLALRKDGFGGDIEVSLRDAPAGFSLEGARIPGGRDSLRATLAAPRAPSEEPVVLRMEARARIDGETVVRPVIPSEDRMQAFAYRHLAASREFAVAVLGSGRLRPHLARIASGPVRIPAGGAALVRFRSSRPIEPGRIRLELSEPPPGVTLEDVAFPPAGPALVLRAAADAPPTGAADNLIVEAFVEMQGGRQGGGAGGQVRRVSLGVLPAIPFEVVRP